MKALPAHPGLLKTHYTFERPHLGYTILLVPHSDETRAKLIPRRLRCWRRRLMSGPVQKTGGR